MSRDAKSHHKKKKIFWAMFATTSVLWFPISAIHIKHIGCYEDPEKGTVARNICRDPPRRLVHHRSRIHLKVESISPRILSSSIHASPYTTLRGPTFRYVWSLRSVHWYFELSLRTTVPGSFASKFWNNEYLRPGGRAVEVNHLGMHGLISCFSDDVYSCDMY